MVRRLPRALAVVTAAAAVVLAGCTDDDPEVPEVPGESATSPATGSSPGEPTGSPTPTDDAVGVPQLCTEFIRTGDVAKIVETSMPSGVRRVYNDDFLESSGRTGRLTCEYGIKNGGQSPSPGGDDKPPKAKLTVAVSAYTEADVAEGRIGMTVDGAGGNVEAVKVSGREGFLLRDKEDISLVFADGKRTYVLTMVRKFVPKEAEPVVLSSLGSALLKD